MYIWRFCRKKNNVLMGQRYTLSCFCKAPCGENLELGLTCWKRVYPVWIIPHFKGGWDTPFPDKDIVCFGCGQHQFFKIFFLISQGRVHSYIWCFSAISLSKPWNFMWINVLSARNANSKDSSVIFLIYTPVTMNAKIPGGKSLEYFTIIANKVLVNSITSPLGAW